MDAPRDRRIESLAVLAEPARRRLYDCVAARHPEPVGRDEAAKAAGISRNLAAFHLDRLVAAGLLEATYRRLGERSGPGAGRPAKLYRRPADEVAVSFPERRYRLAAELLARALAAPAGDGVIEAARAEGQRIGRQGSGRALDEVLEEQGYEPLAAAGSLKLRNCPFHALASSHEELVCAMNLALLEGLAGGLGTTAVARRQAESGFCCVRFERERRPRGAGDGS